ncbi:MAG: hypothetical protein ACQEQI_01375 [Bacillota bacterium]
MKERLISSGLIIALILTTTALPLQAEDNIQPTFSLQKLSEVEKRLYDDHLSGSLLERVKKLEKSLYGRKMSGSLIERARRIFNLVLASQPNRPSLSFTISALEWTIYQEIRQGSLEDRVTHLEEVLVGSRQSGSLSSRVGKLLNTSLPDGEIKVQEVEVPRQTLVKIEFLEKVSSEEISSGQSIDYQVAEDLVIDGKLILPAGTKGQAKIKRVERANNFGRDGEIELSFNSVNLIDDNQLDLVLDEKAVEKNESMKLALGASIVGSVILGPVGLISGYFVKGDDEVIKPNQKLFLESKQAVRAYGLPIESGMKVEEEIENNSLIEE